MFSLIMRKFFPQVPRVFSRWLASEITLLSEFSGVMACPINETTPQGYDMQFGTNVIG